MDTSFLGGVLNRPADDALAGDGWRTASPGGDMFLRADAPGCRLFTWDSLAMLVRGYARPAGRSGPPDAEAVAETLRCHYLEHGDLAVNGLEGSFTVVLLDGQARRALLYRNLVGAGFTYYHAGPSGLLFGGNLADLVEASGAPRRPNRAVLPLFFLYRFTPGPDTLFEGFHRLLPGEQLRWDERGLTRRPAPHLRRSARERPRPPATAVERLHDTMRSHPGRLRRVAAGRGEPAFRRRGQLLRPGDLEPRRAGRRLSAAQFLGQRGPPAHLDGHRLRRDGRPGARLRPHAHPGRRPLCRVSGRDAVGDRRAAQPRANRLFPGAAPGDGGPAAPRPACAARGPTACSASAPPTRSTRRTSSAGAVPLRRVAARASSRRLGLGRLAGRLPARQSFERLRRSGTPGQPDGVVRRLGGDVRGLFRRGGRGRRRRRPARTARPPGRAAVAAGPAARRRLPRRGRGQRLALDDAIQSRRGGPVLSVPRFADAAARAQPAAGGALPLPPAEGPAQAGAGTPGAGRAGAGGASSGSASRSSSGWRRAARLRPLVERIGAHDFLRRAVLARAKARPNWFLYSLLCYDLWHKLFIERSLPFPECDRGAAASGGPCAGGADSYQLRER